MALTFSSAALYLAATTTEFNRDDVTPGPAGFILTAVVGLGVILLASDLVRRLRRVQYREEAEAVLDAEEAAAKAAAEAQTSPAEAPAEAAAPARTDDVK